MSTYRRLTLIGLYNHYPELFKYLTLPDAYHRETFLDVLLLDQGEKRVAYPEPEFFSHAVGIWSRKWAASLERIALAMTAEYNPLHNYDRYEEWKDHEEGEYKNNVTNGGEDKTVLGGEDVRRIGGEDTTTTAGEDARRITGDDTTRNTGTVTTTETGTRTEQTNNMTTERTVSAFNDTGYQPDEKSVVNGSVVTTPNTTQTVTPNTTETVTHNTTDTLTRDNTETVTHNTTDTLTRDTTETVKHGATEDGTGDDMRDRTHEGRMYGNIGVTTSVQMLTAEVDARKAYNMYAIAAELFADDLLLMIY